MAFAQKKKLCAEIVCAFFGQIDVLLEIEILCSHASKICNKTEKPRDKTCCVECAKNTDDESWTISPVTQHGNNPQRKWAQRRCALLYAGLSCSVPIRILRDELVNLI